MTAREYGEAAAPTVLSSRPPGTGLVKLLTVDYEYDYPGSERAGGRDVGVVTEAVLSSFVTSLAVEVRRDTPGAPFQCLASRESPHSHSNAARQNLCQERWAGPRLQSSLSRVLVVR